MQLKRKILQQVWLKYLMYFTFYNLDQKYKYLLFFVGNKTTNETFINLLSSYLFNKIAFYVYEKRAMNPLIIINKICTIVFQIECT